MTGFPLPDCIMAAWFGALGLLLGSFINTCVDRWPKGQSVIAPRSHCDGCGTVLFPLDLVPLLGYALQRGRCRHCGAKIPLRLPVLELITGIVCALCYLKHGLSWPLAVGLPPLLLLIAAAGTDYAYTIIPDRYVVALAGAGVVAIATGVRAPWYDGPLGALAGGGTLLAVLGVSKLIYKREGMGWGDIKLMAAAGLALGLRDTLLALFLGVLIGAAAGAALLALKRAHRHTEIPFGPALAAGCIIAALYGEELIEWYINAILGI